jgi:Ca-activated chloride channel family protein
VLLLVFKKIPRENLTQWILRACTVALILTSALRPTVPSNAPSTVYNNNYDVYFVVDLTSSMVAEDWGDSEPRINGVREDINNLLDDYAGAKYSLITFNSSATQRVPLTPDSSAIATSVNTMLPEVTRYSTGSSISEPVDLLTKELKEDSEKNPNRARIVLYFGDGEQTASQSPDTFEPVKPYIQGGKVYGYGTTDGGKMKEQTGLYISADSNEYIKDKQGNEGISKIDETNLQTIATQLGADYEHRNANNRISSYQISSAIMRDLVIAEEGGNTSTSIELYWIPLIPASALISIDIFLIWYKMRSLGFSLRRKSS